MDTQTIGNDTIIYKVIRGPFDEKSCLQLIDVMRSHADNSSIQTEALRVLVQISAQAKDRKLLCKQILQQILATSHLHPQDFDLQLNCCWLFINLAIEEANRKVIIENAISTMIAALSFSRGIVFVQVEMLRVFIGFARYGAIQGPSAGETVDAVIATLRAHPDSEEIHSLALLALAFLSADPANKAAIASRALDEAVACMRRHPAQPTIQARACQTVANTPLDPAEKHRVAIAALDPLLAAMRAHPAAPETQIQACRALCNLTVDSAQARRATMTLHYTYI